MLSNFKSIGSRITIGYYKEYDDTFLELNQTYPFIEFVLLLTKFNALKGWGLSIVRLVDEGNIRKPSLLNNMDYFEIGTILSETKAATQSQGQRFHLWVVEGIFKGRKRTKEGLLLGRDNFLFFLPPAG